MNFLFGAGFGLITAVAVYATLWFVVQRLLEIDAIPEEVRKYEKLAMGTIAVVIGAIVFTTSFGTYGPRIGVTSDYSGVTPERQAIEAGKGWDDAERDRFGEADEVLAKPPVRADISEAVRAGDETLNDPCFAVDTDDEECNHD